MSSIDKVACFGAGVVGSSLSAVMACNLQDLQVDVFDDDTAKISQFSRGQVPLFEPGLQDAVLKAQGQGNLRFTADLGLALAGAKIVFVCVNTPIKEGGIGAGRAPDLSNWERAARRIADFKQNGPRVIVECSTTPIRTADCMRRVLQARRAGEDAQSCAVLCLPAFLDGGRAVQWWTSGHRYLLGGDDADSAAVEQVKSLLTKWRPESSIVTTKLWSAELSKMALNAIKAQRIVSSFTVSAICEKSGADSDGVLGAVGRDSRLGSGCMAMGPGLGGPTMRSNLEALVYLMEQYGLKEQAQYWQLVLDMDIHHRQRIARLLLHLCGGSLKQHRVAVLGYSYKANSSDTRNSPSFDVATAALNEGAQVALYDPRASADECIKHLGHSSNVVVAGVRSAVEACSGASAIVVTTDWSEFAELDWQKIAKVVDVPCVVIDTRRVVDKVAVKAAGLDLHVLGTANSDDGNSFV